MLAAVNSKHGRYDPTKWMMNGRAIKDQQRKQREQRKPMTGEQVLARFRQLGVPIIDNRVA